MSTLHHKSPIPRPKVLMLRIEPAGYMLALARALHREWRGEVKVVFAGAGFTQLWEGAEGQDVLPTGRLSAMRAFRRRIEEMNPDIVHVAGWSAPPALAGILTGHARKIPVVVDMDTWRGTPSLWRGAVKRALYPSLLKKVTHFAPGGARQAAYLRGYGVPAEKITPVGMTVDVTAMQSALTADPDAGAAFRRELGLGPEAVIALFVGRLVALKGVEDLLTAWPRVASAVPNARLVIAGDGPLRGKVADAAQRDARILPVGRLDSRAVLRAYAAADFVVQPSHFDNWGLVVNEAMATGTPALITDIFGCVGELAQPGQTAAVIAPHAPDKLADAMIALATCPPTRQRLAAHASAVISDWTIEKQAARIIGIWDSVLTAPHHHGGAAPC